MQQGVLNNLIHINRFSGTQLIKQESVSDHVWGMMALAFESIDDINKERSLRGLKTLDKKEVIYRISIHDIDEAFYTDIPRPFKYYNDEIHEVIEKVAHQMMRDNLSSSMVAEIDDAKSWSTPEGVFVRCLDHIQCGLKMVNEIQIGNTLMKSEIKNILDALEEVMRNMTRDYAVELGWISKYYDYFKSFN